MAAQLADTVLYEALWSFMKLYEALMIVGVAAPLTPVCWQMPRYVQIPRPRTAVEHSETNYSVKWSEGAGATYCLSGPWK